MDVAAAIDECRAEIARLHATDRGNGLDAPEEFRLSQATNKLQRLLAEQAGVVITNRRPAPPKRVKHRKAKKKTAADMVPNPCHCSLHDWSTTGRMPKKHTRATSAYDLCTRGPGPQESAMCQVYQLFRLALATGRHPADFVEWRHWFTPTEDDRDHLDWVCLLNAADWLREPDRVITESTFMDFLTNYRSRA